MDTPSRDRVQIRPARPWRGRARAILALAGVLALAAPLSCGGESEDGGERAPAPRRATLVLDFVPNAVHAGIYRALADGCYEDRGVALRIVEPSSTADTLKLILAGRADLGIADGIDVAGQVDAGRDAKGVAALTQRPLGGVIALRDSGVDDPSDLEGKRVGVTGVPSDEAVLDTVVAASGGDPSRVDTVTIGFNGVHVLETGRVDAFTGYVAADGTQVELDGHEIAPFPLDEYGGPRYPGLVMFSTGARIEEDPDLIDAVVGCTVEGYEATLADPDASLRDLLEAVPGLDPELAEAQLEAYLPLFAAGAGRPGGFRDADLEALSEFLVENDLIEEPIDPERFATDRFVTDAGS